MTEGYNINSFLKIIYNFHAFENCACIIFMILNAVTRVNLPFCHKSMTVICEVGPQRFVMCIKNKNDKLDYIVHRYMYQNLFCIYKMIRLCAAVTCTAISSGNSCWQLQFNFNPLTAGAAYIRIFIFYQHIKYYILNILKIKCDMNQQDLKRVDLHFVKAE